MEIEEDKTKPVKTAADLNAGDVLRLASEPRGAVYLLIQVDRASLMTIANVRSGEVRDLNPTAEVLHYPKAKVKLGLPG